MALDSHILIVKPRNGRTSQYQASCTNPTRGSRQFCQRGSNFDNFFLFCFFLLRRGSSREDPNITINGQSSACQRNVIRWRADNGKSGQDDDKQLRHFLVNITIDMLQSTNADQQPLETVFSIASQATNGNRKLCF